MQQSALILANDILKPGIEDFLSSISSHPEYNEK